MDFFEAANARRSVRNYKNTPVPEEKLASIWEAVRQAPSACNLQPWEFIILDEPEDVALLKECLGAHNGRHYNAPAAIVVCSNTSYIPWEGNGALDCGAAIENLLLAATALGLGTVWIGDIDAGAIARLLDIPEHVAVISVVLLGYPAEDKPPRTQYTEEAVYWGRYDRERPHAPRSIDLRFL